MLDITRIEMPNLSILTTKSSYLKKKNLSVISVDTNRYENIGNSKNAGQEYCKIQGRLKFMIL
jgi:hypothetical protein